ncbi:11778_t:CDS:2, partial [Cetraspora pellucida]
LFIISYLENVPGATIRGTANKFEIQPKQIRDWRNKQQELLLAQPHIKHLNSGSRPNYPELEAELAEWIQALPLAKLPKYILQYSNINEFKWSSKWLDGFLRRYNFSNHRKTTVAQKLPVELETQQQA